MMEIFVENTYYGVLFYVGVFFVFIVITDLYFIEILSFVIVFLSQ